MSLVTCKCYAYIRNRQVKDVNFGFQRDSKVLSGSDDGRLFIFNKQNGEIENILEGDGSVVNVMTTHPRLPVLAVSGIDETIKIFAPTSLGPKRFSALADKDQILAQNAARQSRRAEQCNCTVTSCYPLANFPFQT